MKTVWILNHYAQEPGGPGGTRHFSLAKAMKEHGWNAWIIAASTEHGTGRERLGAGERQRIEHYDGVPFLWLRTSPYSGNGSDRVRNMLGFVQNVLDRAVVMSLPKPDVVVGSSVHPFAAWAALRLARRYHVPFVFEVRDLWPQSLIDMGRLARHHPATYAMKVLEKYLYRKAARIIVLLPRAAEYIRSLGVAEDKIVWIPNGADISGEEISTLPDRSDRFQLMYFGAHGDANGLDTLLQAMTYVEQKRPDIALRLIGTGPHKPALQAMAIDLKLSNVRFEDPVPKAKIPALASEADAFVLCVRNLPGLYRYGISMNKIFDYLAATKPIIISANAANNPIEEARAGISVPPEDAAALAAAILEMASLPAYRRREMGLSGRQYLEVHHDMRMLGARFAATLAESVRSV